MASVSYDNAITNLSNAQEINAAQPHKDSKVHGYIMKFNLNAIKKVEETSSHHAATFNVDAQRIRKKQEKLNSKSCHKRQRHQINVVTATTSMLWPQSACYRNGGRSKKLRVSLIMIMKKTKLMYN